ncbi:MAG: biotin synthase [Rubrivivax sp.]
MDTPERSARRPVDAVALAQTLRRLHRLTEPPWLHAEVARRMADRLPLIRMQPRTVLDWDAALGASRAALAQAYPRAQRVAVESVRTAPHDTPRPPWWSAKRWNGASEPVLTADRVENGQAQLVWSNMALHLHADPQTVMRQWHAALVVDGFLMFSTLGPGSLAGLRSVHADQGWAAAHAPFVDMHDLGDMLIEAGFADPVMDQEQLTLTWASADALLDELRQIGGNASPARFGGLRTPRWRARLAAALRARAGADGRIGLTFELVYGHAFRPAPRPRVAAETRLPLDDLRAMVRAGREGGRPA